MIFGENMIMDMISKTWREKNILDKIYIFKQI